MNLTGRVDAHHHLWSLAGGEQGWLDEPGLEPIRRDFAIADLEPLCEAAGVSTTVLVQTLHSTSETLAMLQVAQASPLVGAVVGWADLTAPGLADQLSELGQAPGGEALRGIRHLVQGESDPTWLARPKVITGLRTLGRLGVVYDLLLKPPNLRAALTAVTACPDTRFVVDHLAKPLIAQGVMEPWRTQLKALAQQPNVVCKISGLVTEADWSSWTTADLRPYFEVALEAFGPERLLLGTDWPVCLLAASYAQVWQAHDELIAELSPAEQDALRAGTAREVYALDALADQGDVR